jgi:hypothetical protein
MYHDGELRKTLPSWEAFVWLVERNPGLVQIREDPTPRTHPVCGTRCCGSWLGLRLACALVLVVAGPSGAIGLHEADRKKRLLRP